MSSKEYFDRVAGQWDQMRSSFFSEAVRARACSVAGLEAGKIAADLGAGTGFMTAGLVQKGLNVIAVDQSAEMLAQLRRNLEAESTGKVETRVGEAEHLPLEDAEVDYAFANMYLHHVESPPAALLEMARILRPGGRLVITDLDQHAFEFLRREHHDRWMGFHRGQVVDWLKQAGFENVHIDCTGEDCTAGSQSGEEAAKVSIFVASGEKRDMGGRITSGAEEMKGVALDD